MKLIRDLAAIPENLKGAALALGNFDGLHLGHRAILDETLRTARAHQVPAAVMTFEPHPREFFNPSAPKLRLMRTREKLDQLRTMGFSAVFMPRFNAALAATSATDFIEKLLVETLAVTHVITGEDFAFGTKRAGTRELLACYGFSYQAIAPIAKNGEVISSSAIRRKLGEGDGMGAGALLGHPYRIFGHVTHGDKRGRTLGFPTANIPMARMFLPRAGVYAVTVEGMGAGVANIGIRPTVGGSEPRTEIHLFSEVGDIYGQYLRVEPKRFLRDEKKFASLDELKAQIARDVQEAQS